MVPCDFLVPENFVINPVIWKLVNESPQGRTKALERAMLLARPDVDLSSLPDLERAGAGLVFTEKDHVISKTLGQGSYALVCKAFLKSRPEVVYALKMEATHVERAVKNCFRQLEMQSRCDPKFVVQIFGWHLAKYDDLQTHFPTDGVVVFCLMMELGDKNVVCVTCVRVDATRCASCLLLIVLLFVIATGGPSFRLHRKYLQTTSAKIDGDCSQGRQARSSH